MGYEVKEVEPEDEAFIRIATDQYPDALKRVKASERVRTDHFSGAYLVLDHGRPVARFALYDNPFLSGETKTVLLGAFDSLNDSAVLTGILSFIKKRSAATHVLGPMNGSTWDSYRIRTGNSQPPFFLEPWHPSYYRDLFLAAGFSVAGNYYSSIDTKLVFDDPKLVERQQRFSDQGLVFRNINLDKYECELEKIFHLSAESFASNAFYSPISLDSFKGRFGPLKNSIVPDFFILVEDHHQKLVAYNFSIPDLFSSEKRMIIKTVARLPMEQYKGIGNILGNIVTKKSYEKGYRSVIHALIHDSNLSGRLSERFSGERSSEYSLFAIQL